MVLRSSPPPPENNANGDVTILTIRLAMACQMTPPMLKFGSLIEPLIGRLTSITPWRSDSSATARRTGNLVALGLSIRSPNAN